MYIETGQELLTDEDKHIAMKAANQGVTVVFEEFVAMPHCFAMVLETLPASKKFFSNWAAFISQVVEKPGTVETKGMRIAPKTLQEESVDVKGLSTFTEEEVLERMKERVVKMSSKQPDSMSKL